MDISPREKHSSSPLLLHTCSRPRSCAAGRRAPTPCSGLAQLGLDHFTPIKSQTRAKTWGLKAQRKESTKSHKGKVGKDHWRSSSPTSLPCMKGKRDLLKQPPSFLTGLLSLEGKLSTHKPSAHVPEHRSDCTTGTSLVLRARSLATG